MIAQQKKQKRLDFIKEEGRVFNAIEFAQLGELTREARRREIIRKIIKFTNRILNYENIALWELDPKKKELTPLFSRGYGRALLKYRLQPKQFRNGIVGYVAKAGYPYIARNLANDPHYLPGIKKAQSSVTVPFKVGHEVFGVLNIESTRPSAFDSTDIEVLREYAGHVAIALNIKRLLDIGEEITISRISKTIAHEVNNPLESMFMVLSRIDSVKEHLSPDMIEAVRTINQNLTLIKSAVGKLIEIREPDTDEQYEIIDLEQNLSGRHFLVIEDEEEVRTQLASDLQREHCDVDCACDGTTGIEMGISGEYDVIITDIKMPGASGYEVFKQIRAKKPQQKVIMMTAFGYDESHSIVKGNQAGLDGVLYKPFTPELLHKVLSRVCQ